MKKRLLLFFAFAVAFCTAKSQSKIDPASIKEKMQWFADAKLGIFIHSGIYAVNGIDESWSFYNKKISYSDYMKHYPKLGRTFVVLADGDLQQGMGLCHQAMLADRGARL